MHLYASKNYGIVSMHINGVTFSNIFITKLSTMADSRWPFNRTAVRTHRCTAPLYMESQCPLASAQTCDSDASTGKSTDKGAAARVSGK